MKLARFLIDGEPALARIDGSKAYFHDFKAELEDLTFLPPSQPTKIVCVGLNYHKHASELGMKRPDEPLIFLKPPSALAGHNDHIISPDQSKRVDFEGELAVVIKKRCKNVKRKDASDCVLGLTCFNDVTGRDLQERDAQWTRAKGFDTFGPSGPWMVTTDEFGPLEDLSLELKTLKNGILMQHSNTNDMIFHIPGLIEHISAIMTLEEGDIISTGTPPGIGPMSKGDTVEIVIEGIGALKNTVI